MLSTTSSGGDSSLEWWHILLFSVGGVLFILALMFFRLRYLEAAPSGSANTRGRAKTGPARLSPPAAPAGRFNFASDPQPSRQPDRPLPLARPMDAARFDQIGYGDAFTPRGGFPSGENQEI
jgi:hypothetical protein